MRPPTVHLNGTSGEALVEAFNDVRVSVTDARERLRHAYPNGRDYYPQSETAHRIAVDEWLDLDKKLREVEEAMQTLVEQTQAQVDARKR